MVQSSRASIVGWSLSIIAMATAFSGCWFHGRPDPPRPDHHEERHEERHDDHHEDHHE